MSSPSLGPPVHLKPILLGPSPPEAQKPEVRTSLIKTPKSLGSCIYINTHPTTRPKQILHYPNPPKVSKKGRLEPENLGLEHHYIPLPTYHYISEIVYYIYHIQEVLIFCSPPFSTVCYSLGISMIFKKHKFNTKCLSKSILLFLHFLKYTLHNVNH